jgi:DNA-directed RNA polymerase alpha subunit
MNLSEIKLAKPALRALDTAGIKTLSDLARFSETELSSMHGIGPNALKTLKSELAKQQLSLKK